MVLEWCAPYSSYYNKRRFDCIRKDFCCIYFIRGRIYSHIPGTWELKVENIYIQDTMYVQNKDREKWESRSEKIRNWECFYWKCGRKFYWKITSEKNKNTRIRIRNISKKAFGINFQFKLIPHIILSLALLKLFRHPQIPHIFLLDV